jgi:hypothetical protein
MGAIGIGGHYHFSCDFVKGLTAWKHMKFYFLG